MLRDKYKTAPNIIQMSVCINDYYLHGVRASEGRGHPSAAGGGVGRGVGGAGGVAPGAGVGGGEVGGVFRHDADDVSRLEND